MPAIELPDPPLEGDGVRLRAFTLDDVAAVAAACQDPEISRWTTVPSPYTEAHARAWIAGHAAGRRDGVGTPFAIVDPGSGALLGANGVDVRWDQRIGEVGYWTVAGRRRRGVAAAGLGLLSRWAVDGLGLERLELLAATANVASQRVAERAGFTREGVLRAGRRVGSPPRREDMVLYALLARDQADDQPSRSSITARSSTSS